MRRTGMAVALGIALAVGGAGWLLWEASEQGRDEADEGLGHEAAPAERQGPLLTGRRSGAGAHDASADEGEFRISGVVLDPEARPVAGVPVEARFLRRTRPPGEPPPDDESSVLDEGFAEADPEAAHPLEATAASGTDGTFSLVVRRQGEHALRPLPAPPLVGLEQVVAIERDAPERVTLRVIRGSALRGRVVDAADRGIDASVVASWEVNSDSWESPRVTTAAGTGAFAFPAVPDGTAFVRVRIPGRMAIDVEVKTPRAEEVVIRLGAFVPLLAGIVQDLEHRPIAGARVGVALAVPPGVLPGFDVEYFAVSNAEGRYRMSGPFAGPVTRVRAEAAGYLHLDEYPPLPRWNGLSLTPEHEATLDLTLWQGGTLSGSVRERGSGAPLAGARVSLLPAAVDARMSGFEDLRAVSDAHGNYSMAGVPIGRSILLVEHATHYFPAFEALPHPRAGEKDVEMDDEAVPDPPAAMTVFLVREGERLVRDIELERGFGVSGRVVDAARAPVEGAEVHATGLALDLAWTWNVSEPERAALARSDADGRFQVTGLAPRREWALYATKVGRMGEPCAPFPLGADTPAPEVVLRLLMGATVVGRVVDEAGNGCANVKVASYTNDEHGLFGADRVETFTASDGAFRLEGLAPGTADLGASHPEFGRASNPEAVEDLTQGEVREGIVLTLTPQLVLSGVLVDDHGLPVRGKPLFSSSKGMSDYGQSDRSGAFQFVVLEPGKVWITAGRGSTALELAVLDAPAKDVRVVWKEPTSLVVEGLVTDLAGRVVPLCLVGVEGVAGSDGDYTSRQSGTATVNGWFRKHVPGGAPLKVTVQGARDAQGRRLNLKDKTITLAEAPTEPVTIALEPGLLVAGRVLDPLGRPVPGVPVSVGDVRETSDADGAFRLGGLEGESVTLSCHPSPPWIASAPQTVATGSEDVVVRLKAGFAVAGRVVDARGRPVTNAWISGTWPATPDAPEGYAEGSPGREGRFRLEGIPEKAVLVITVEVDDDGSTSRRVTGVRAGTEDLLIDLGAGVTVEGLVVDAQGRPFSKGDVEVALREDGEDSTSVDIQDDGTFRATGLSPGPVWLSASRNDGGPSTKFTRIEAPATKVRLVLPPTTPIAGRVVGADAKLFTVWAWNVADKNVSARAGEIGNDGRFSIEGAGASGTWMVGARLDGDDRYALAGPLPAGSQDVVLELRSGRTIEGTLAMPNGSVPVRNSWVVATAEAPGMAWRFWVRPDEQGRFVLRGMPPGRYKLETRVYRNGRFEATREGVEDGTRDLKLVLARAED